MVTRRTFPKQSESEKEVKKGVLNLCFTLYKFMVTALGSFLRCQCEHEPELKGDNV